MENLNSQKEKELDEKINIKHNSNYTNSSNSINVDEIFKEISEELIVTWENILLPDRSNYIKFVKDDCEILNEELNMQNQRVIKNDCDRTRVKDKNLLSSFREYLESFLTFYCKRNNIKYKQGMNEIVAPFLLLKSKIVISLSRIYNLFASFMEKYLTNYFHEDEFFSLQSSMGLLNILLKYHDSELYNVFEFALITPEMYATSWVLTIFAKYFNLIKF